MVTAIKPIETVYKGYKFRSRTEARWAVFFDTLGIEYRYEKEGFDLNGAWYLPDFWLPKQKCWVEIKGEKPTTEAQEKSDILQIYTGQPVHTFYGDVWIPSETTGRATCQEFKLCGSCHDYDKIWARYGERYLMHKDHKGGYLRFNAYKYINPVDINPQVLYILYCLSKHGAILVTNSGNIDIRIPATMDMSIHNVVHKMVKAHYDELVALLCPFDAFQFKLLIDRYNSRWAEFPCCQRLDIKHGLTTSAHCDCSDAEEDYLDVELDEKAPCLLKAYTAARQARFDGR